MHFDRVHGFLLNYRNKKSWIPNNVRSVFVLVNDNDHTPHDLELNGIFNYVKLIESYLVNNRIESKDQAYIERACSIINKIKNKKAIHVDDNDIVDLAGIFIILLRNDKTHFPPFAFEDLENIQSFYSKKILPTSFFQEIKKSFAESTPHELFDHHFGKSYKQYKKSTKGKYYLSENEKEAILNFMYIYTVLFLCRGLDMTGAFLSDKENNENE